ncbi:endonuclease domain-containing protein [Pseudaminobacter salicylatoxidans]|uniref:endonuclease domain-containing protein n=1 Tax=Pseudaminobacter salicylatoxidans TaxID=93369 RepID=UPI000D6B6EB0|nr:endonuclease domain-containing protein [Pseudaminobacter salicylatoxidans]
MTVCECTQEARRRKNREAVQRYRERNRQKIRDRERRKRQEDPKGAMKRHQKWFAANKNRPEVREKANALARRSYAKRRQRKLAELAGRPKPISCDVCGAGGKICFDHCHISNAFRGWLCHHCNLILGHAKDDPTILRKLATYLEDNAS